MNNSNLISSELISQRPSGKIPSLSSKNVVDTFVIIILSSLIFLTIFSYADVVRTCLDIYLIKEDQKKQLIARIFFSIIVTLVTLFLCLIIYLIYKKNGRF